MFCCRSWMFVVQQADDVGLLLKLCKCVLVSLDDGADEFGEKRRRFETRLSPFGRHATLFAFGIVRIFVA